MEQSFLMSASELSIIAAASGMDSFLMFDSSLGYSKEQHLQSILRLANDGFFVSRESTLSPSSSLFPILGILRAATVAVVARLSSREAAPVCIYYGPENHDFLRITPRKQKRDSFELRIVNEISLIEDFEASGFLPELRDQPEKLEEEQPGPALENRFAAAMDMPPQSVFEKYSLASKSMIDEAQVAKMSYIWKLLINSTGATAQKNYSRHGFMAWIKGSSVND